MHEFMTSDNKEIKNESSEKFKNIKPASVKSTREARGIIDKTFRDEKEKYELNQKDKNDLINGGMSEGLFDKCSKNKDGVIHVSTYMDNVPEGKNSETNVKYENRIVNCGERLVEIRAPKFDSKMDYQLPKELLRETDVKQFNECNNQLREKVLNNSKWAEKTFSQEQLEQIKDGNKPRGFTWHHDVQEGKMQLVETSVHQQESHTGGRAIWGGGGNHRV